MGNDAQASVEVNSKTGGWRNVVYKRKRTMSNKKISKFDEYLKNNRKSMGSEKAGEEKVQSDMETEGISEQNGGQMEGDATNTNVANADDAGVSSKWCDRGVCVSNGEVQGKRNANKENIKNSEMVQRNNMTSVLNMRDNVRENLRLGNDVGEKILYSKNHVGNIAVLVDTMEVDSDNRKVRNGLYLFERIRDLNFGGIRDIKTIGRTLYRVSFDNVTTANSFVLDERLRGKGLRAFIPRNLIETYGVIRDVPIYISDEDIMRDIKSSVKVTYVRRFLKKNRQSGDFVKTLSVKIGFAGSEVPEEIYLNFTRLRVDIFYPAVKQCHNCGRLGHTRKGCKSRQRCLRCGKDGVCESECGVWIIDQRKE